MTFCGEHKQTHPFLPLHHHHHNQYGETTYCVLSSIFIDYSGIFRKISRFWFQQHTVYCKPPLKTVSRVCLRVHISQQYVIFCVRHTLCQRV